MSRIVFCENGRIVGDREAALNHVMYRFNISRRLAQSYLDEACEWLEAEGSIEDVTMALIYEAIRAIRQSTH